MTRQHQFSCTMLPNSVDTFPTMNLSCVMASMEPAAQTDCLRDNADNIWFVLGAYFFAFFPWAIMHNIDFISEKWRTCRRTRELACMHVAGSVLPIIYVAVYAEAQRRAGENTEFGAALAALMFNAFQLLRTIMGIVQLNAFVAWCKNATECMNALLRDEDWGDGTDMDSRTEMREQEGIDMDSSIEMREQEGIDMDSSTEMREQEGIDIDSSMEMREQEGIDIDSSMEMREQEVIDTDSSWEIREQEVDSSAQSSERSYMEEARKYCGLSKSEVLVKWFKRTMGRNRDLLSRNTENRDQGEDVEEEMQVNNMVVDNELGGREVTISLAWKKMIEGMKEGRLEPSKWLHTDQVMLNTVRWCGAFLCSKGGDWSVDIFGSARSGEMEDKLCAREMLWAGKMLEKFFSRETGSMLSILGSVEWRLDKGISGVEHFSVEQIDGNDGLKLNGEMSTAYGTGLDKYWASDTWNVDKYSLEFNNLVSSYPAGKSRFGNRDRIRVGLAHSLVLAKHVGVEKLKAIKRYYDMYRIPSGPIREIAFKLLQRQSDPLTIIEDSEFWKMFRGVDYRIPLFPYRMQAVALWDYATNWRVLQASAHQDIHNSRVCGDLVIVHDDEVALDDSVHKANIFEYSANWSKEQVKFQSSLGVVIETVRTFLAEWIAESEAEPNWEPEIPKNCIELDRIETISDERIDSDYLVWVCQRELQKILANMGNKGPNFAGNTALIMLFLLGFPFVRIEKAPDSGFGPNDNQEAPEANAASSARTDSSIDLYVQLWRVSTNLAPHNISLIIQVDVFNCKLALKLRNDGGNARFKWQDWVNVAMGCLKGIEERDDDKIGFVRTIVKPDLRKPMVELSPLHVNENVIHPAKIWMGWLPFDVRICKFELEQWCATCNINLIGAIGPSRRKITEEEMQQFEGVIEKVVAEENAEVEYPGEGPED